MFFNIFFHDVFLPFKIHYSIQPEVKTNGEMNDEHENKGTILLCQATLAILLRYSFIVLHRTSCVKRFNVYRAVEYRCEFIEIYTAAYIYPKKQREYNSVSFFDVFKTGVSYTDVATFESQIENGKSRRRKSFLPADKFLVKREERRENG